MAAVKLSRVNTYLLVIIVLINGYIIAMPFVPGMVFWAHNHSGNKKQTLTAVLHSGSNTSDDKAPTPTGDRLVIPSMLLDTPFYEGASDHVLNKGAWLRPNGSTPEKGANTIIAAHRFTYTNPEGEFYHLDKVKVGDEIGLFKNNVKYLYTVRSVRVVAATEVSVEAPTDAAQLTLYTCTPLWLPKDRLVIIAMPQSEQTSLPKYPQITGQKDPS